MRRVLGCVGLTVSLLAGSAGAVGFLAGSGADVGDPIAMGVSVDLDRDGYDDLLFPLTTRSAVGILWNRGLPSASFAAVQLVAVGVEASYVAVADFDRDGNLDLAVVPHSTQSSLVIRRGDGARGFLVGPSYALPGGATSGPRTVAAADLDGDGLLDLVSAEKNSVVVLHGRGDGTFDLPRDEGPPGAIVAEIFVGNVDGRAGIDVLLGRDDGIHAWNNDGSGRLIASAPLLSGAIESDFDVFDANGDGVLDVVATRSDVVLYRNDGSGGFAISPPLVAGPSLAISTLPLDLNGDGFADLVSSSASGVVVVRYGDGAGSFLAPVSHAGGPIAGDARLVAGDWNGDGDAADLVHRFAASQIQSLVSASAARLGAPGSVAVGSGPIDVAELDIDADGDRDLVSANRTGESLSVLANDGGGGFMPRVTLPLFQAAVAVEATDIDRDGFTDLVALTAPPPGIRGDDPTGGGELVVYRNARGLGFDPPVRLLAGQGPMGLASGDVTGDMRGDVVVLDATARTATVHPGAGAAQPPVGLGIDPRALALADFDGDGDLDMVVVGGDGPTGGRALVFENTGSAAVFEGASSLSTGMGPAGVASIDLDLDGLPDLAVILAGSRLSVATTDGGFGFTSWTDYDLGGEPSSVGTGFMNCDSAEDLLVTVVNGGESELLVFLSEGNGGLAPPQRFRAGMGPAAVASASLDGIGADDPVIALVDDDALEISFNTACGVPSSCRSEAPLEIVPELPGCSGFGVPLAASAGFSRYRWGTGASGPGTVVAVSPGNRTVAIEAWDSAGCLATATTTFPVGATPDAVAYTDTPYVCAGDLAGIEIPLRVVSRQPPTFALLIDWKVDPPGVVRQNTAAVTTVAFPPGTAVGDYQVSLLVIDGVVGCSAESSLVLHLVNDAGPTASTPNRSLRLYKTGAGAVRLSWDPANAWLHTVSRSESPGGASATILGEVAGGSFSDTPANLASYFYSVVARPICMTSAPY